MSGSKYTLHHGVEVEHVGNEVMVYVPGRTEVLRLSGEAAEVVLAMRAGGSAHASWSVIQDLESLGVIHPTGVSRRGLIKAGAIGAGAGIAVMAMPSVAAASSSFVFDGDAFWWWGSDGGVDENNTVVWLGASARFDISSDVDFLLGEPSDLLISTAIPKPDQISSANVSSTVPENSSGSNFADWRTETFNYSSPISGDDDPLENINLGSLTGTFSVPGQGTFTVTFTYQHSY